MILILGLLLMETYFNPKQNVSRNLKICSTMQGHGQRDVADISMRIGPHADHSHVIESQGRIFFARQRAPAVRKTSTGLMHVMKSKVYNCCSNKTAAIASKTSTGVIEVIQSHAHHVFQNKRACTTWKTI